MYNGLHKANAACESQSYQKDTYTNVGGRRSAINTFFTEQAPHELYISRGNTAGNSLHRNWDGSN